MDSITFVQEALLSHIKSSFVQPVHEVAIPDEITLPRDENGEYDPYIAVQFGDLQQVGNRNMASSLGHNYVLPVYFAAVASDATVSRRIMNKLNMKLLGFTTKYSGQVEKRAGGMIYMLPSQSGAVEAYVGPTSFGIAVDLLEV